MYMADTFDDTRAAFTAIADELRNQYLIGYYPASVKRDGKYHKIKLELARKGVEVRARPGYRAVINAIVKKCCRRATTYQTTRTLIRVQPPAMRAIRSITL